MNAKQQQNIKHKLWIQYSLTRVKTRHRSLLTGSQRNKVWMEGFISTHTEFWGGVCVWQRSLCLLQVWQCGGSVEVLPCSRIAHIERAHKPYTEDLTAHVRRNALRVAEVWMDEFKSHVYMAWNIPQEVRSPLGLVFGWEGGEKNPACN